MLPGAPDQRNSSQAARPRPRIRTLNVDYWQFIGTDRFETLGARIVRGRTILRSDTSTLPMSS